MLAVSAQAQPDRATVPARKTPATGSAAAVASTATADSRHATAAAVPARTTFTSAVHGVVLADGIVAPRLAPMPPAAGFQYER